MLRLLRIRSLAVIEAADVEFEDGFTVLTGETGAGKSMLVEAVALLLGGRATADLIRTGDTLASVEALFQQADGRQLTARREVTASGRNRAFIDGTLTTASALREAVARFIELHGQHEHQLLLDPQNHLPLLDAFAGRPELGAAVARAWVDFREIRERIDRRQMDVRERTARLELLAFQLGEIDRVAPLPGEDETLQVDRNLLSSADRIKRLCDEGYAALYDSDQAALGRLGQVWKRVDELAGIDSRFAPYIEAREAIKPQLEDLAFFLRSVGDSADGSPQRLQEVDDRLVRIEHLKRKYGPTLNDVIERRRVLGQERGLLEDGDDPESLTVHLAAVTESYVRAARELSTHRRMAAVLFAGEMAQLLTGLAMPDARFDVRFQPASPGIEAWGEQGMDRVEFYLSPNVGEDPRPLARVVSGGELSRVMLAMKTVCGAGDAQAEVRTVIFDEVDAGIGGRVADVVGTRLATLGANAQVLCITHLPQIAARATSQFRIDKRVQAGRTHTTVTLLDETSRIEEIARMIGGAHVDDAMRASARHLIEARRAPPAIGGRAKAKVK